MQIQVSLDKTNTTNVLHNHLWEKPRSPATIGSRTHRHTQTESPTHSPTHCHHFLMCTSSIGHTCRCIGLVIRWSIMHKNLVLIRECTRSHVPLGFLPSVPCTCNRSTRHPYAEEHLLTSSDDVITPRQQPHKQKATLALNTSSATSAIHISSIALSTSRHLADCWPGPTRPGPPRFDP